MVNVTVEVIKPFVHSYPVKDSLGDFTEDRLVPGPDGFLVKRPIAFKKIEGFVKYSRFDGEGKETVVTEGTGLIEVPKEVADTLVARGCVRVVPNGYRVEEPQEDVDIAISEARPPRNGRRKPEPLS